MGLKAKQKHLRFINSLNQYFKPGLYDYMPGFVRGSGHSDGKEANVNYSLTGE